MLEYFYLDTLSYDLEKDAKRFIFHLEHYSGGYLYFDNMIEEKLRALSRQVKKAAPPFLQRR